ncbi:uncharacterized protein [Parasteatoda tepidariorum]|uniref:uncharacterized protein n=1 Tax=Parasteatoda tepidariorum TaxID=114398 RepID=UPI001C718A2B|nr:uncharacterized protein LOC122269376 [Parasteatoda tepidariorum]
MTHNVDKSEIISGEVWKHNVIYFNAHSPKWDYQDINDFGKEIEDLLCSSTLDLIFDHKDPCTFLHYNGKKYNPDLLLASAGISSNTKGKVLEDPGSGHQQVIAEISLLVPNQGPTTSNTSWNFRKVNWMKFKELTDKALDPKAID